MSHEAGTVKIPSASTHSARHIVHASPQRPFVGFSVGFGDVPQQTQRLPGADGTQTDVTRAQRFVELPVISVAVGVSMVGRALATQTPSESAYPTLQVYSHFVAVHALTRDRVMFDTSPVSSPSHRAALVGVGH